MSNTTNAPLMLGVSGLRGIAGASLTPDNAARFAAALAAHLHQHNPRKAPTVIVARDGRLGGEAWHAAAVAALVASGCHAVDAGIHMTPTVAALADTADAAIVVTASHNPQEWNGLKLILRDPTAKKGTVSAAAPPPHIAEAIIRRYHQPPTYAAHWSALGSLSHAEDPAAPHVLRLTAALEALGVTRRIRAARFNILLDSCGASGDAITPWFLTTALRATVTQTAPYTTGRFPHTPEPTKANLRAFARRVRAARAHVGFAQDPDADRLAIIDDKGRYIGEELTLVLAATALAELDALKPNYAIVANLSTSRMIDDLADAHRCRVIRTPVGEASVANAMKHAKAPIGGEGNGGVIWPAVTYVRDSLSAIALTLALIATRKTPLSAIVDAIPAYAILKHKLDLNDKAHAKPILRKIAHAHPDARHDTQDGLRLDWPHRRAWLHVRPSNTEPILRLIAEAPTAADAKALIDHAAAFAT